MQGPRTLVRILVGAALALALAACAFFALPEDLPPVALGQTAIYRLEVAVAVFYGCLLILTPGHSGLTVGRLPIEISTRGARFAAEADERVERDAATIESLEQSLAHVATRLANAEIEIDRLK